MKSRDILAKSTMAKYSMMERILPMGQQPLLGMNIGDRILDEKGEPWIIMECDPWGIIEIRSYPDNEQKRFISTKEYLELYDAIPNESEMKCECGAEKVSWMTGFHSRWCPKESK